MSRFGSALIACLATSLATSSSGQASLYYLTGGRLYELCTSSDPTQQAECFGYLEGIVDAPDRGRAHCIDRNQSRPFYPAS
jgi:hypothetical protein